MCNKANSIHDFIVDHKLDALALTETWLKGDERDNVTIQELLPPGYNICQQARANRGGGVAIIYHSRLTIQNTPALHQYTSFEAIECDIVSSQPVKLIVLYQTLHWGWLLAFELVSLPPEHRNTQRDRDTQQIIHRSYQGDTRQ